MQALASVMEALASVMQVLDSVMQALASVMQALCTYTAGPVHLYCRPCAPILQALCT